MQNGILRVCCIQQLKPAYRQEVLLKIQEATEGAFETSVQNFTLPLSNILNRIACRNIPLVQPL